MSGCESYVQPLQLRYIPLEPVCSSPETAVSECQDAAASLRPPFARILSGHWFTFVRPCINFNQSAHTTLPGQRPSLC